MVVTWFDGVRVRCGVSAAQVLTPPLVCGSKQQWLYSLYSLYPPYFPLCSFTDVLLLRHHRQLPFIVILYTLRNHGDSLREEPAIIYIMNIKNMYI